jgi:hypothetical protein
MSALVSTSILGLAACSASVEPASDKQPTKESIAARPAEDLAARVVKVTSQGELCPPRSAPGFYVIDVTGTKIAVNMGNVPKCDPNAPVPTPLKQSLTPSCTITLELEVPEGLRVGVPATTWFGYFDGPGASVTRSYSFDAGESSDTAAQELRAGANFQIVDVAQPAFSSCSGSEHVKLTATFRASILDEPEAPSSFHLDSVDFGTSFRQETDFKDCNSPGALVRAEPGPVGEWCGGSRRRPCASGLACDINGIGSEQGRDDIGSGGSGSARPDLAQGTCVDLAAPVGVAALGEPCDGLRDIQCAPGATCWHEFDNGQDWTGQCVPSTPGEGDRCGVGLPVLDCPASLVCHEGSCIKGESQDGEICERASLPSCANPLACDRRNKRCRAPLGVEEDPCGPGLPDCQSPLYCQNKECFDPRGRNGAPCGEGTLGCYAPLFVCAEGECVVARPRICE